MNPIVGLVQAIAAAALAGGFAWTVARSRQQDVAQSAAWRERVDRVTAQLNELLMPLTMVRSESRALRDLLPRYETDGVTDWRLVHHAGTIGKAWRMLHAEPPESPDADQRAGLTIDEVEVAKRLLDTGDRAITLIDGKTGLLRGDIPESFELYKAHHKRIKVTWDTGIDQVEETSEPYPGPPRGRGATNDSYGGNSGPDLDDDIKTRILAAREDQSQLLDAGPHVVFAWRPYLEPALLIVVAILFYLGGVAIALNASTQVMIVTPDEVRCGELGSNTDGQALVGRTAIPGGAEVEVVDAC